MKVRSSLAAIAATLAVAFGTVNQSSAAVVGFVGTTLTSSGYASAPVGTAITAHVVFTAAAAASTSITGGWVLLGAQYYAITAGTLAIDHVTDSVTLDFTVGASTPGGFAGGAFNATIDHPGDPISVSEATQANVFAVAQYLGSPTGWTFDPGAPGAAGGLLSGNGLGVPEPSSMAVLGTLCLCWAGRRFRRRKQAVA